MSPSTESLVQILLPLRDNEGRPFTGDAHGQTRQELLKRFGGVTAYQRAPARKACGKARTMRSRRTRWRSSR